jgi:hypothetical protein
MQSDCRGGCSSRPSGHEREGRLFPLTQPHEPRQRSRIGLVIPPEIEDRQGKRTTPEQPVNGVQPLFTTVGTADQQTLQVDSRIGEIRRKREGAQISHPHAGCGRKVLESRSYSYCRRERSVTRYLEDRTDQWRNHPAQDIFNGEPLRYSGTIRKSGRLYQTGLHIAMILYVCIVHNPFRVLRRGAGTHFIFLRPSYYSFTTKDCVVVSIYRVHFTWKEKPRILKARSLDMTHPYFVSIRGLIFPESRSVIIDPSEDELQRDFGEAEHIMIPFQNVSLIEEIPDRTSDGGRVIPFSMAEDDDDD